eukprot:scaffold80818_cov63-Phaeocystis_antarctica.AAC.1
MAGVAIAGTEIDHFWYRITPPPSGGSAALGRSATPRLGDDSPGGARLHDRSVAQLPRHGQTVLVDTQRAELDVGGEAWPRELGRTVEVDEGAIVQCKPPLLPRRERGHATLLQRTHVPRAEEGNRAVQPAVA